MNKILIGISILFGSILVVTNFAVSGANNSHIIIGYSNSGVLSIIAIFIGFIAGFGIKGYLSEKGGNDYNDDEGVNF